MYLKKLSMNKFLERSDLFLVSGKSIRKQIGKTKENIADTLDMPQEVLFDLPKITCIGNNNIIIENHRGVIEYSSEKIRVGVSFGEVRITGYNLEIYCIFPERLEVKGVLKGFSFD